MKTLVVVLLLSILFPGHSYAKDGTNSKNNDIWVAFEDSVTKLTGFKDLQGNVKISPQFERAEDTVFRAVAVVFSSDSGWICIDRNVKFRYYPYIHGDYEIDSFKSGLRRIGKHSAVGFGDMEGNIVIPEIYDYVTPFAGDYAAFYSGGIYTCSDRSIPDSLCEYKTWQHGLWGIINKRNDTIIAPHIPDIEGLDLSTLTDKNPGKANFIRVQGKGKDYYIEDIRKTFNSFLTEFIVEVRKNLVQGLNKNSLDYIDCKICYGFLQGELKSKYEDERMKKYEERSFIDEMYPIRFNDFARTSLDSIFTEETLNNLSDVSKRKIRILPYDCNHIDFASAGLIPCDDNQRHFIFTIQIESLGRPYWESFQFIDTPEGIKLYYYNRHRL